jgi:hypothetical protein
VTPAAIADTISEVFIPFPFALVVPGKLKYFPRGPECLVLEGGDTKFDLLSNPRYRLPTAFALGVDILDNMWHFAPDRLCFEMFIDILLCRFELIDTVYFEFLATGAAKVSQGIFMKFVENLVVLLKLFFFFFFDSTFFPSDSFDPFDFSL